jgi:hypothetical protein
LEQRVGHRRDRIGSAQQRVRDHKARAFDHAMRRSAAAFGEGVEQRARRAFGRRIQNPLGIAEFGEPRAMPERMIGTCDHDRAAFVQRHMVELRRKMLGRDHRQHEVERAVTQTRHRHARKSFDEIHARVWHLPPERAISLRQHR